MNRNDLLLVGLGGGGGSLVNSILEMDARFQGLFINTSMTDLESLDNLNKITKNYFCISTQNGVGRNRVIGKEFAEINGNTIVDLLEKHQQETIYLVSSLGGGSGSSILSVLLDGIQAMKEDGDFDKTVNLIGILPDLKSPDIILKNTLETWDEIIANPCINSMIFVNNDTFSEIIDNDKEREEAINEKFSELFDSIFDIPEDNGTKFDNGNLTNVLKDKGCLYIYDLPSDENMSVEVAMIKAEKSSVLAKMYKSKFNTVIQDDGSKAIKCGYLGMSFNNNTFNQNYLLKNYKYSKELYVGNNGENNLLLVSGCLPPVNVVELINLELEDRKKNKVVENDRFDYSKFKLNSSVFEEEPMEQKTYINKQSNQNEVGSEKVIRKEKRLKKNLFKR